MGDEHSHPACRMEIDGKFVALEKEVNEHELLLRGEDKKSGLVSCIKDTIKRGVFWKITTGVGLTMLIAMAILYGIALSGPTEAECKDNAGEIVELKVSVGKIQESSKSIAKSSEETKELIKGFMDHFGEKVSHCERVISDNARDIKEIKEKIDIE